MLASACSGQLIDLGENVSGADAASCRVRARVSGSVTVESQEQLDQLVGCEEIAGDLLVRPFEAPDFTPLASLRRVGGTLELGRLTSLDEPNADPALERRELARVERGWLGSLEGFESLEQAGNLSLRGVSARTLEAFSSLSQLTEGGALELGPCTRLRDLRGLEALTGLVRLQISCDSLDSLRGLSFPSSMGDVSLQGARLVDLGDFDVQLVDGLLISGTALASLDALSRLVSAVSISVTDNAALVDMDALGGLESVEDLIVEGNPRLRRLPDFVSVPRLSSLLLKDNPTLANVPLFPGILEHFEGLSASSQVSARDLLGYRPAIVEIMGNAALQEVTLPSGWQAAGFVAIESNALLTRIRFTHTRAMDFLSIQNNPSLGHIELGTLATVDELWVTGNPLLPLSDLDGLLTFESVLSED